MTATAAIYRRCYPLNAKEFTAAVRAYARKHGHYADTVRTMTTLRQAAVREFIMRQVEAAEAGK